MRERRPHRAEASPQQLNLKAGLAMFQFGTRSAYKTHVICTFNPSARENRLNAWEKAGACLVLRQLQFRNERTSDVRP